MNERARATVASIATLPDGSEARLDGRIVSVDANGLVLWDETGTLSLANAAAPLGAWVSIVVRKHSGALVPLGIELVAIPRTPFPSTSGDFHFLQADGGRRAKLLAARASARRAVRDFFDARGYLEVETPTLVPSPGLDVHLVPFEVVGGATPTYLGTSPEYQMKRLLAGGLPRIYQMGRCYRREEAGTYHEPEFTMLEWYRAFADADALMSETEELVAHVLRALTGGTTIERGGTRYDLAPPWPRLTVDEAFTRFARVSMFDVLPDEDAFFRLLVEKVEPGLAMLGPCFLHRWPAAMASLARLAPDDERVAERFEAYVAGIELCNGFDELTDPTEQRARFVADQERRRDEGREVPPIDERFLAALEEGMPRASGNALGFDRLVLLATGAPSIEDVVAIPARRL